MDQVSFSVPSGFIVGLIGENGAGKSTTINAALGLIQKEAGQVSVLGKDGLDPVIRDDILDMLLDFVQEEDHSILVSSHITSDVASNGTDHRIASLSRSKKTSFWRLTLCLRFPTFGFLPLIVSR